MDDPSMTPSRGRNSRKILIALWLERHRTVLSTRCTDLRGIPTGRHQWEGGASQEGRVMNAEVHRALCLLERLA